MTEMVNIDGRVIPFRRKNSKGKWRLSKGHEVDLFNTLDVNVVRTVLEETQNDSEWFLFLETNAKEQKKYLQKFVTIAMQACVEAEMPTALQSTLQWLYERDHKGWEVSWVSGFEINNGAFMRACQKNDFEMIGMMTAYGFAVHSTLEEDACCEDFLHELVLMECASKPSYLLARFEQHQEDPMNRAFKLLNRCKGTLATVKAHEDRIKRIVAELEKFTVDLLDKCEHEVDVERLLNKQDTIPGLSSKAETLILPRIHKALQLENIEFVNHESCQKIIRERFFDAKYSYTDTRSWEWRIYYLVTQVIFLPVFVLAYIIGKIAWPDRSRLGKGRLHGLMTNLDVPVNNLIAHLTSYGLFLLWILLHILNPMDVPGVIDLNFYDILLIVWSVTWMIEDIRKFFKTCMRSEYWCDGVIACIWDFHRCFIFVGHFTVNFGLLFQFIGFKFMTDDRNPDCPLDDPQCYGPYHPVRLGTCFLALGMTLVILQVLQYVRFSPVFGPLHIAMKKVISDLGTIMLTYTVFTLAFGLGIFLVFRNSSSDFCSSDNAAFGRIVYGTLGNYSTYMFHDIRHTFKTLVWSIFEPGHPEVVGCSDGIFRYAGMVAWFTYELLTVVILLNLLIALMNATMTAIYEDRIAAWKFHRVQMWMNYSDRSCVLPPPFNVFHLILNVVRYFRRCLCREIESIRSLSAAADAQERYDKLIKALADKYIHDFEDSGQNEITKEHIDVLRRDLLLRLNELTRMTSMKS